MRSPTLTELPPPPPGKNGWPWTEESPQLPDTMPDGSPWPKASIVTPSYNQEEFVEETIRSVLLQGYPNLEYIVIDGGSTDSSVDIIHKYEKWLAYWISEDDQGQAHAINKGFAKSTGDLLGWINSDDLLLPEAISHFALAFKQSPRAILLGDVVDFENSDGLCELACQKNVTQMQMVQPWCYKQHESLWHQPGTYVPRYLYQQIGGLDETLRFVFDREWMYRLLRVAPVTYLRVPVAQFRLHGTSKTIAELPNWPSEYELLIRRYWDEIGLDKNLALANLEMLTARIFLRVGYWNRQRGLAHLGRALRYDWRVMLSLQFSMLCIKAIMPFSLLHITRRFVRSVTSALGKPLLIAR